MSSVVSPVFGCASSQAVQVKVCVEVVSYSSLSPSFFFFFRKCLLALSTDNIHHFYVYEYSKNEVHVLIANATTEDGLFISLFVHLKRIPSS